MFKFIVIVVLIGFLLNRLIKFILKYALVNMAQKQANGQNFGSNDNNKTSSAQDKKFKKNNFDGDYVDYEVVK